jgi:RES domain-containing protein
MKYAIIGSGKIGTALARIFARNNVEVAIANSRGTEQTRELPENWRQDVTVTRAIGDEWLSSVRTAILLVPSAIVPEAQNVLVNPAHREFESIRVVERRAEPFDLRLIKKS